METAPGPEAGGASGNERSGVEGMLLIDKPAGLSSHDLVLIARRVYGERSIGHLGTLDPFATGLLVLLLGRSTRLAGFLEIEPKVYEAAIAFGSETDTDDSTGATKRSAPPPSLAKVDDAITQLTGTIIQTPPDYSAKSVDGARAYKAARKGAPLEQQPVTVVVHRWDINGRGGDELRATITCSGGTYIRALARDLGRITGSAAHLASLRRLKMGALDVRDAMSIDELKAGAARPRKLSVNVSND